jgi:hypothetical protein
MNKIKLTIILTLFAALCTAAYGQVTVGSSQPPVEGALLDIKEFDPDDPNDPKPDNTTAKKGLLMPRVNLSKKDQLYPMFESTTTPGTANADYNDGTKKSDQDKKHTGLVVYNVKPVPTEGLDVGVHSWDGSQWVAVKSGGGSGTAYSGDYPIVVENSNIYLATKKMDGSTPLINGSILRFNGTTSAWEVVVPVDNDTQYTGTAPIAVDASTHVISVKGSATAGEVLTSNGDGTAKWAELKSSGGTQPTIPDNNKPVLEAGSGPWLVYYNAASYTSTAAFKFTGTAFVMCYAINNSATVGTNVESSTWMGVVTGTTSFLGRVDNRREYYVIYPATDLTVEYLLNVAAYPWYLFHM